eukprot:Polyplicarium_translucidae@DN2598_c0_g1_i2.p1
MDSLYAQSLVMLALRDTLKELADNFFIRRDVADKIHAQGCHVRPLTLRDAARMPLVPNRQYTTSCILKRTRTRTSRSVASSTCTDSGKASGRSSLKTRP